MEFYKNFEIEDFIFAFEDSDYKYDAEYEIHSFIYCKNNSFIKFEWDQLTRYIKIEINSDDVNLHFFGRYLTKILLLDKEKGIIAIELEYEFHTEKSILELSIQLKPKIAFNFDLR